MKGICWVKGNGYTPCLPILFFLCVSHVADTYQSEVILQDDSISYKKSNFSSWIAESMINLQVPHSLPMNIGSGTSCKADNDCQNGGKCVNNFCKCLPGTSGDKCHIVDACSTNAKTEKECGDFHDAYCGYNQTTHKHYCRCLVTNNVYDTYNRLCKKCLCGPDGNCSFVNGAKTCHCKEGYAEKEFLDLWTDKRVTRCEACECGEHSDGCEFRESYTKCFCHEGYDQDSNRKCSKCDCGPHGKCHFDQRKKICDCDPGFSDNAGTCETCICGPHGECTFQNGDKTCSCKDGYAVDDTGYNLRICKKCNCYVGRVEINCTFSSGIAHCFCPPGYKQSWSTCVDIDECLDLYACPSNTNCENTPGSYECHCKTGYKPFNDKVVKVYGCQDINECVEYLPCPFTDTTHCLNTPGSYACICKAGYVRQSVEPTEKNLGCWKDQSLWKFGYIFLIILYIIISLGLLLAIFRRYRANHTS